MSETADRPTPRAASDAPEPVAPPADPATLAGEARALPPSAILASSGPLTVFFAGAQAIPHLLYEIGRLREATFRAIGEGTGKRIDLDWFDSHYLHLVLWNRERSEVVGAYRCAPTDHIIPKFGVDGLYTASLFAYGNEIVARLVPALELGRSFVRLEYQKTYFALLLLWRAIAEFVVRSPRYKLLFGAVSISNAFGDAAQRHIVEYLREKSYLPGLARFVRPRNPLVADPHDLPSPSSAHPEDLGSLEREVLELEGGARGVPVLLKQYLKLGGRVLSFARDPDFSDTLDALVLVDLSAAPVRVLERYMGPEGACAFFEYHRPTDLRRDDAWPPA
jgi:Acetyltransferase (GNAT) domain